jgi:hypothetical protein
MDTYQAASGFLSTNRASWSSYGSSLEGVEIDPFGGASTSNYYNFECLDAALNVKARARVLVRDWDREFSPEDDEIEKINADTPAIAVNSAATNVSMSVTNGANAASVDANVVNQILTIGSYIFLDINGNGTLEPATDTRYLVTNKSGLSLELETSAGGTVTDPTNSYNFFIHSSKFDDTSLSCFGSLCDVRGDFDRNWNIVNGSNPATSNTGGPLYGSCGESAVTELTAGAVTISFSPNSTSATLSAPLTDPTMVAGTVITVSSGGNAPRSIPIVIRAYSGGTGVTLTHPPGFTAAALPFQIIRKFPFPLEGHQ